MASVLLARGVSQSHAAGDDDAYLWQRLAAVVWGNAEWPAIAALIVGGVMLAASFRHPPRSPVND